MVDPSQLFTLPDPLEIEPHSEPEPSGQRRTGRRQKSVPPGGRVQVLEVDKVGPEAVERPVERVVDLHTGTQPEPFAELEFARQREVELELLRSVPGVSRQTAGRTYRGDPQLV